MVKTETSQSTSKTLTFLFTDLEGSTLLWQQHPDAMKTALARHDDILRSAIEKSNGKVIKTTGDGFLAAFDSTLDSLNASIRAQHDLHGEDWGATGALRVRMGLHIGEVEQRGGDYFGTTLNRTARLMSAAHGGQVLLSATIADMVSDQLPDKASLRDLGEHRLKDLQRPEHIFQLVQPGLPDDFPLIVSLNRLPNNLPSQPTVFVGRTTEQEEVNDLLRDGAVRLLTLLGPGGTGKTRLALQSAAELIDRFVDGTYFIDLAPVREPDAVLTTIARTIGFSESSQDSMLNELKEQLQEKKMLLLLDNFEQVVSASIYIAEIIKFCPYIKLLVTSREALHVRGEHLYPVPPLGLPDGDASHLTPEQLAHYEAVQLFVDRARTVSPDFELTEENASEITDLCLRLDGLPLAIELAAARMRMFSPQALHQKLGSRLKLLRGGARDLPERQQTLRSTIDWSYDLLSVPEKSLFEVLSVFSSSTFDTVEEVAAGIPQLSFGNMDIVDGLVSLVDKSLIRIAEDGTSEPRIGMLETIREYASEQLGETPDLRDAAYQAHATLFADIAQKGWRRMTGYERETAMEQLAAEVENLLIAWRYWIREGNLEQLNSMVDGLWSLFEALGWYQAMVDLTTDLLEVLSVAPSSPEKVQQEITLRTSFARALMALKGYTPEVEQAFTQALQLSEGQDEIPQLFPVLRGLSNYYMYRAEFDKGVQIGVRILELADSRDDDQMRVHGYLVLGANTGFISSLQEGLEILEKGIALFDPDQQRLRPYQVGNNPGIVCYTTSAIILWWLGYPHRALERAETAIELATKLNHPFTMAYALFHTGVLHMWLGDFGQAKNHALTMLEIALQHDYQLWISLATIMRGAAESQMGQTVEGLSLLEQGIASYLGHKSPPVFWPQLTAIRAQAYGCAGRPADGLKLIDELFGTGNEQLIVQQFPELVLLRGDLILALSPGKAAMVAEMFRQLLAGAREAGGRMLALQAATRLCRLDLQAGSSVQESAGALGEIYVSFTEGFDTPDLQEARAVLDEIRSP